MLYVITTRKIKCQSPFMTSLYTATMKILAKLWHDWNLTAKISLQSLFCTEILLLRNKVFEISPISRMKSLQTIFKPLVLTIFRIILMSLNYHLANSFILYSFIKTLDSLPDEVSSLLVTHLQIHNKYLLNSSKSLK